MVPPKSIEPEPGPEDSEDDGTEQTVQTQNLAVKAKASRKTTTK